jgi:hypothetical protein
MRKALLIGTLILATNLAAQSGGNGGQQTQIGSLISQINKYMDEIKNNSTDTDKKEEYEKDLMRLEQTVQDLGAFESSLDKEQQTVLYEAKRILYHDWYNNNPASYYPVELKAELVKYLGSIWADLDLGTLVDKAMDRMRDRAELSVGYSSDEIDMLARMLPYMVGTLHNNKNITWEHKMTAVLWAQILIFKNLSLVTVDMDALIQSSQKLYRMIDLINPNGTVDAGSTKRKYLTEVKKAMDGFEAVKGIIKK